MRTAGRHYMRLAGRTALAAAALGLVSGCGVSVDSEPKTEEQANATGEQYVDWNPCSDLSEEALHATGADPASRSTDFDAPGDRATWRMCAWNALEGPYYIGIGATTFTQDDVKENTSVTGFASVQINGRSGLSFYPSDEEDPIRRCYVSLPKAKGMLTVYVDWRYGEHYAMPESPPCGPAVEHARKLEPYFPE